MLWYFVCLAHFPGVIDFEACGIYLCERCAQRNEGPPVCEQCEPGAISDPKRPGQCIHDIDTEKDTAGGGGVNVGQ
eukprot:m.130012 g.130012  ORF g.130012 m.130012 type:complete len:76 (+) comp38008_c0_seq8:1940-2167(+)